MSEEKTVLTAERLAYLRLLINKQYWHLSLSREDVVLLLDAAEELPKVREIRDCNALEAARLYSALQYTKRERDKARKQCDDFKAALSSRIERIETLTEENATLLQAVEDQTKEIGRLRKKVEFSVYEANNEPGPNSDKFDYLGWSVVVVPRGEKGGWIARAVHPCFTGALQTPISYSKRARELVVRKIKWLINRDRCDKERN